MSFLMPSDKALSWLVIPLAVFAMEVAYFHLDARPRQPIDWRPGERLKGPRFDGRSCPKDQPSVGETIPPRCIRANGILGSTYGLSVEAEWNLRWEGRWAQWARIHDDAVLSYCSLTWCRVVAVVPHRFKPEA